MIGTLLLDSGRGTVRLGRGCPTPYTATTRPKPAVRETKTLISLPKAPGTLAAIAAAFVAFVIPAAVRAQAIDDEASHASDTSAPSAAEESRSHSVPPFLADEARARGYELPRPYGAAFVITRLGGRKIQVDDLRIGINEQPGRSVSDFADLGSTSDVFNAKPGPVPGEIQVDKRVPTSLDGIVGGIGMTSPAATARSSWSWMRTTSTATSASMTASTP
jgi:hypothetical protein